MTLLSSPGKLPDPVRVPDAVHLYRIRYIALNCPSMRSGNDEISCSAHVVALHQILKIGICYCIGRNTWASFDTNNMVNAKTQFQSQVHWKSLIYLGCNVKGIFSDSNNIFLWHKSEDIKKKRLFPKFQLILISVYKLYMNMYISTAP